MLYIHAPEMQVRYDEKCQKISPSHHTPPTTTLCQRALHLKLQIWLQG